AAAHPAGGLTNVRRLLVSRIANGPAPQSRRPAARDQSSGTAMAADEDGDARRCYARRMRALAWLATSRRMRRLLHEHHHCDHAEHDQDEPDDQHRQQSALVPGRTGRVNVEVLSRDHCHSPFRPMTPLAEAADVSAGADRRQGPLPLCGFANRIRVAGCGHPDATGLSRHDLAATAIGWRSKPPDWGTMDHVPSHARRRADRS
ncbi:MAG: hypothetical protein K0S21_953, partial [Rhizobiaceae bacterium]|nr:hypothetical protein [Rhizobiaceae bacterium]